MIKEERNLLELQKKLENGMIGENDLSEEEKSQLIELYKEQIEDLHRNTEKYKKISQEYKEKIIAIRKKMNN